MATAKAQLSNYRQAPRKVRLVADLVRGKSAARALMLLDTLPKRASVPMAKLIRSAVANAQGASASDLYISKIAVDGGIVFKRMMPRARGRGAQILKRTSHVVVELETSAPKKAKAPKVKKQEETPAETQ
jgi:large subunit ribosomal protein L22